MASKFKPGDRFRITKRATVDTHGIGWVEGFKIGTEWECTYEFPNGCYIVEVGSGMYHYEWSNEWYDCAELIQSTESTAPTTKPTKVEPGQVWKFPRHTMVVMVEREFEILLLSGMTLCRFLDNEEPFYVKDSNQIYEDAQFVGYSTNASPPPTKHPRATCPVCTPHRAKYNAPPGKLFFGVGFANFVDCTECE